MSDTTKLILWIILALVVIAIIILLVRAGSRRRQEEARRREATSLRAQARAAAERARGHEAEASSRVARAAELTEEANGQKAAAAALHAQRDMLARRADRVDPDVAEPAQVRADDGRTQAAQTRAAGPRGAQTPAARPDGMPRSGPGGPQPRGPVSRPLQPQATQQSSPRPGPGQPSQGQPSQGQPSHGQPNRGPRPAPAIGLGLGAPDFDDDEPDLADADNPFGHRVSAPQASRRDDGLGLGDRTSGDNPAAGGDHAAGADHRPGGQVPIAGTSAEVPDGAIRDADAGAGDTREPGPREEAVSAPGARSGGASPEPATESTSREGAPDSMARDLTSEESDPDPAAGDAREDDDAPSDVDWVNGPVENAVPLEDVRAEEADAADWINGPEEAEPVTIEVPERSTSQPDRPEPDGERFVPAGDRFAAQRQSEQGQSEQGQSAPLPDTGASDPAAPSEPTEEILAEVPEEAHAAPAQGEARTLSDNEDQALGSPDLEESSASGPRLVSRLDEVVDGGHGVGSAAPIADGAQPLGHPIKAWRDTMTYVLPGGLGYEGGKPDVWFHSEQAAQAAGYRRGGA